MNMTRRELLKSAAGLPLAAIPAYAKQAPAKPVAVAKCPTYGAELAPTMERMFDQLGGLGKLVKGKTVSVKINLTGSPTYRLGHHPLESTTYTHPRVIGAAAYLMAKAGARRIRLLESPWNTADPLEEYMLQANWEPLDLLRAAPNVEFENTNYLGRGKKYSRFLCPHGGYMYPGFDLNSSFEDCDVFVSIAKMKDHGTAGITLSMKNHFGSTPCTIYGTGAGVDGPSDVPSGGRSMFHSGHRQPSKSAPQELHPNTSTDGGYRVPRVVTDVCAARPIDLAIIDGIETMSGGEGPWIGNHLQMVKPGVLVAGTNCVNTDAVAMSVMGYDPMADRGKSPFERADSTLRLAEDIGLGTRDLKRIEVVGTPVREALFSFLDLRLKYKYRF